MIVSSTHFAPPRALVRAVLRHVGLHVRINRSAGQINLQIGRAKKRPRISLPPLMEHPLEALHFSRGGKVAAFLCPIEHCVTVNGLNFSRQGWHPFSAALEEVTAGRSANYSGSLLERFYRQWNPVNAQQAFLDENVAPPSFAALPSHLIYLFPWSARSVDEADLAVRKWTTNDHLEHGGPRLHLQEGWLKDHGPIAPDIGAFEYKRLLSIFESLRLQGFDRQRGEIVVVILKRGSALRFLNFGGGLHRTAAMAALGHTHVPARLLHNFVLDVDDVAWWPQVQKGVWPESHAKRYIDHLFDFDARGWARKQGLIQAASAASPPRKTSAV